MNTGSAITVSRAIRRIINATATAMKTSLHFSSRFFWIWCLLVVGIYQTALTQGVDNPDCPPFLDRTNGGRENTLFASNISPTSLYFLSALSSGHKGNLKTRYFSAIHRPPVVNRTWLTPIRSNTYLDWIFGNNDFGSPINPPGIPEGTDVTYSYYNHKLPDWGIITLEMVDPLDGMPLCVCSYQLAPGSGFSPLLQLTNICNCVSSGAEGGLESKSLGTAVAENIFSKYKNGTQAVNYQRTTPLQSFHIARTTGMHLSTLLPEESELGTNFTGYMTSPVELKEFTNAKEVVSVDYLKDGANFATLFATETSGQVYEHAKYVCDRLKGGEIMAIDSVQIGEYHFIRSLIDPLEGLNEYSISFSIGFQEGSSSLRLQSAWLLDDYQPEEHFFNFQLWSADAKVLHAMVKEIIGKVQSHGELSQPVAKGEPGIFISKAERIPDNPATMLVTIWNQTNADKATLQITTRANENTENTETSQMNVSLEPMRIQQVTIDTKDYAETSIEVLTESKKEDYLYESDGLWTTYIPSGGQLKNFVVENESELQPEPDSYPIWRNITLSANNSAYATVYKTVRGGGIPVDLSEFKYLNFEAYGTGQLTIRLIKKSIENFESHYTFTLPLSEAHKTYSIPLESFTSSEFRENLQLDDLVILSFSAQHEKDILLNLQRIRFSKHKSMQSEGVQSIMAFPNPVRDKTTLIFNAAYGGEMNLGIYSIATGDLIQNQVIETRPGENQQEVSLLNGFKRGIYIVKLANTREFLTTKILVE